MKTETNEFTSCEDDIRICSAIYDGMLQMVDLGDEQADLLARIRRGGREVEVGGGTRLNFGLQVRREEGREVC